MLRDRDKQRGVSGSAAGPTLPTLPTLPILPATLFRGLPAKRGAGVGAFLLAIVTAGALAHVGVRIKGLQVAYDLGSERRIATELEEQRRRLQIEIGMLKDPGRVVAIARDKLNMGPPAPEAIWRLGSGAALDGPAPPPAASVPAAAAPPADPKKARASTGVGAAGTSIGGPRRRTR
jgi:cell division protein FtsL